jgi:hypothetical protein
MDQHALAGPQAADVEQTILCRDERDGEGGRLDHADAPRYGANRPSAGEHMARETVGGHREHALADLEVSDPLTDGGHDTRALAAERRPCTRIHSEHAQHVTEIQSGRVDRDLHLARCRSATRQRLSDEVLEGALGARHPAARIVRCGLGGIEAMAHQPADPALAGTHRDLGRCVAAGELVQQLG